MNIRKASENDFSLLSRCDRHIRAENLREAIGTGRIYIAENEKRLCGWLRYGMFWDNTPFMNMLFVTEGERGRGTGRALTEYWEEQMRMNGFGTVMTSTQSDEFAQHFYMHLGYSTVGGFMQEDGVYELIMMKKL